MSHHGMEGLEATDPSSSAVSMSSLNPMPDASISTSHMYPSVYTNHMMGAPGQCSAGNFHSGILYQDGGPPGCLHEEAFLGSVPNSFQI